jgi:hypothetical protein
MSADEYGLAQLRVEAGVIELKWVRLSLKV